jgi:hypothetical protein
MTNKKTLDPHQRKNVRSCDPARGTDFAAVAHVKVHGKSAEQDKAHLFDLAFLAERGCLAEKTTLREVA